jgi:hypothetical protein
VLVAQSCAVVRENMFEFVFIGFFGFVIGLVFFLVGHVVGNKIKDMKARKKEKIEAQKKERGVTYE